MPGSSSVTVQTEVSSRSGTVNVFVVPGVMLHRPVTGASVPYWQE